MHDQTKILLVEDDIDLGDSLKQFIEFEGFDVHLFRDGKSGLEALNNIIFDICILDVMLPDISGFEIAKKMISVFPNLPFLFLTARQQKLDRLTGLKLGADDYITKPFEADELILRLKNILKRANPSGGTKMFVGAYCFDYENLSLLHDNEIVMLTEKEATLLKFLIENPNQILKREYLLKTFWGEDDYFLGRSMDVFISRLRKLLSKENSVSIDSVRGVGFIFRIKT